MKFSDAQREALKRYFQELERRPQEATEFFARLANELRGQRVYLTSQSSLLSRQPGKASRAICAGCSRPTALDFMAAEAKEQCCHLIGRILSSSSPEFPMRIGHP